MLLDGKYLLPSRVLQPSTGFGDEGWGFQEMVAEYTGSLHIGAGTGGWHVGHGEEIFLLSFWASSVS
jgi:hypothetical protein